MGADCDRCALQGCAGPVPPENHGSTITLIGEAPTEDDVKEGRPFVSRGGMLLTRVLQSINLRRQDVNYTNVVLCHPPEGKLKKVLTKVQKERKAQEKAGVPADKITPYPHECCAPRLHKELAAIENIVPMGGYALKCIMGNDQMSILEHRGNIHDVAGIGVPGLAHVKKVLPTVHPAFVMQRKSFMRWFTVDLGRAWRWFHGALNWVDPTIAYVETPTQLASWFAQNRGLVVYDTETFYGDPRTIDLKCIGFSTTDNAIVLPWMRWHGGPDDLAGRWYPAWTDAVRAQFAAVLVTFFTDPTTVKGGWNSGYFDRIVIETHFGVTPAPHVDGILLHKVVQPEMRHALAVVAPGFLDIHAWKGDAHDKGYLRKGKLLWDYCALDCVTTARLLPLLYKEAKEREQLPVFNVDQSMQDVCVTFKYEGLWIDQEVRGKLHNETQTHALMWAADARKRLGELDADAVMLASRNPLDDTRDEAEAVDDAGFIGLDTNQFNPGSPVQVGALLYERWQLPLPKDLELKDIFTDTGIRSTSDGVLRAYICDSRLSPEVRDFIQSTRMYRKKTKLLSYIRPLRFEPGCEKPICRVSYDGRIHADWNAHGTSVGRLSASLVQTLPKAVMKCVAAPPGWSLVYADMDQLHLRIIAARWQIRSLLQVFREHLDPHGVFAEVIMPGVYADSPGYVGYGVKPSGGLAALHRDVAKRLRYAGAYWAQPPTIHRVLLSAENDGSDPAKPEGTLANPGLKPRFTKRLHADWMTNEPEWEIAWKGEMREWKDRGYSLSPLLGRRKDFPDANPNDIVNYPIISMEGDLMSIITIDLAERLKKQFPSARFVNQCHDSVLVECPDAIADGVAALVENVLNRTLPGWEVPFVAKASIGRYWADLK